MIEIDLSEIMGLRDSLSGLASKVLDRNVAQGAFIAGAQLQSEARSLVPVDMGALRLSIENDGPTETQGGYLIEVGPTQPYGYQIEFGRPAGTGVTAAQLMGWAKRKGLNPYAVAHSINAKGSPAQPFMFPAMERKQQSILLVLAQAVANAFNEAFGK